MWGDHIGNFSVKVRNAIGGPETTLWSRNTQMGNYWERAEVVLSSTQDFQVHLGTVGSFLFLSIVNEPVFVTNAVQISTFEKVVWLKRWECKTQSCDKVRPRRLVQS